MMQVLGDLSAGITDDFTHPLLTTRGDERYLVVFVTADKGLAGAFNANLIKAAQAFLKSTRAKQSR
jgi:F-type H+-transporting ATPase subunit gamma